MSATPKPRGLVNLGNTCYFNSIIQVLLNAPYFGPLLEERTSSSDNKYTLDDTNGDDVEIELPECDFAVKSLVNLYKKYIANPNSSQPIAPTELMNCIRQKTGRFQRAVQEDSHELLRSLLDIIRSDEIRRHRTALSSYLGENKLKEVKTEFFTIIDIIFGGYFLSSVECQKCKMNSQHLEPFYDLSLAITDPISDIKTAISNFTSNATLDGDNKFICDRCTKANGKKTYEAGIKSTTIAVPPNILTLHLKRFEANTAKGGGIRRKDKGSGLRRRRGGRNNRGGDDNADDDDDFSCGANFRKINKHVEFSEILDLSDYTSDLCYDLTKINKWPRAHKGDPIWYSLIGVICHSGNLKGGHYTAYVKCEEPIEGDLTDDYTTFIQTTPYIPELANIEKIHEHLKRYDADGGDTNDNDFDEGQATSEEPRPNPGVWYHISDSDVRRSTLSNVLNSQAYIVLYRRIVKSQRDIVCVKKKVCPITPNTAVIVCDW